MILEQVTAALWKRGTLHCLKGWYLDFVTAHFIEFYFTIHHLNDENTQIALYFDCCDGEISYAYKNTKKCSQTNLLTVTISLE